jgi:hypothetical protein
LLRIPLRLVGTGLQLSKLLLELRDGGVQGRFAGGTRSETQLCFSSNDSA